MSFAAYVIAKNAALAVVLAVQVAIFGSTVEIGFLVREALGGESPAAIGLLVSACVRSTDKGVLAVPLLITPEILLGATILPIRGGMLAVLAKLFSPRY